MLEPILKGLVEWLYQLMVDIMGYASGELLGVMSMDLSYFETTAPIISEIVDVFIALGWALLIGNLVFQMLKVMMSGAGFEAEDPKILFMRTFVFAFLLLASRQICEIGSAMTGTVINMLELPGSIEVKTPDESMFSLGGEAKWLLVIIVGVVLMVQMVKLLFEIGERYVITSVLTFFAPLAFSMGGSKNTNDIFRGWCRMYGSILVMMIMNIVFLKLIMSAMSRMNSGGVLIWLVFVVALTRVARKIDSHIGKIGLNPAQTGSGIGSRLPGMMTMMAVRVMSSTVSRSLANAKGGQGTGGRGYGRSGAGGRPGAAGGSSTPKHAGRSSGVGTPVPSGQEGVFRTGSTTVNSGSRISGRSDSYGGGTNVNIGGSSVQEKQSVQNKTGQPGGSRASMGRPGVGAGGTVSVPGSSDMNQQSYQTQSPAGTAKQRQITPGMRPPIPRGTAGTVQTSRIQQSVQSNQDSPGGQSGTRTRPGTASRRDGAISVSAPQIHSQQQSVSRSNRQNGNQSAVISGEAQSHTDISGSVRQSNQGGSRDMRSASYGGAAGCGPTSLAIVVSTLTGRTVDPPAVCAWSVANGHRCEGNGSYHSLIPEGGKHYGLTVEKLGRSSARELERHLASGHLIIAIMSRGHFTSNGHFIVLRGITHDGKVLVADPASYKRSGQEWDMSTILTEANSGASAGGPFWSLYQ